MNAITVNNISKTYRISSNQNLPYRSLRDELADIIHSPLKLWTGKHSSSQKFFALKNVSFTVQQGETIGIIGPNGAGKSTLLKILSRITPPTNGEIRLKGRVSSLLEVGTGFHPELTGRENIFL